MESSVSRSRHRRSRKAQGSGVFAALAIGVGLLVASKSNAAPDTSDFPQLDIAAACHERANYAFAATLGQADAGQEFDLCLSREGSMRDVARTIWATSKAKDRTECAVLAQGAYSRLARCLDSAIPAPAAR